MAFLSEDAIAALGFSSVGKNVSLSDKASFYNCKNISIGDDSRIDDFCVVSAGVGGIHVGSHVHLAVGVLLIGAGKIVIEDFANLSSRVAVYSSSDDYSGSSMTNPTVPDEFRRVSIADVTISRHVIVGSGSVILPGVTLEDGVAVGALSLVTKDLPEFGVYAGIPARRLKARERGILELENAFRKLRRD